MKTIWKYEIPLQDKFKLKMPFNAKPLTVQVQHGVPCLWVLVDTSKELEEYSFRVVGTGHQIKFAGDYIGTFQISGGSLVFHVFQG